MFTVAGVLVAAAAGLGTFALARHPGAGGSQGLRPSGIPASVSTRLANLMVLSPLPRSAAPGFRLTDQAGRALALPDFRGKVVVLEFMDDHCHDICPIVAQEFVEAYHDLGPAAGEVVFAAVNVNPYYTSVHSVAAFSAEQRLTTIPDWHFFTGPVPALRAAWRGYHIDVQATSRNNVEHTSAVYFIDPQGRERYLASPQDDHTKNGTAYLPFGQIAQWGQGIAQLARTLTR
ncbi:MAG: SCO family protein [Micromonosporaceae bacterium]